ncbi:MAG: hypothetical protein R2836_01270 [Chitinophagales bacterium]
MAENFGLQITEIGTYMVKDIYQGSEDGILWVNHVDLKLLIIKCSFEAEDGTNGTEL